MEAYLHPQDDGLPMRKSGAWVVEKLDYLKRYIDFFETSMRGKPWRRRHYIDLFAGPGKCCVSNKVVHLGSPLLALVTPHPFTNYFFVDNNDQNIEVLRQRCSAYPDFHSIRFYCEDANSVVHDIVECIQAVDKQYMEGRWSSLNLAFLDPDGLELKWKTVASLATLYRMDLIIHYSQMGLNRYMPTAFSEERQTIVDDFFGGTEWRSIYERYQQRQARFIHRELINHYKEKLQDLGYKDVRIDYETGHKPLIRNARRNAPLYRLLFASKHRRGHDFWQKVTQRSAHGQTRLL